MFPRFQPPNPDPQRRRDGGPIGNARSGLTFIELLVAAAIMAMIIAALAMLAKAVQVGVEYGGNHGEVIQNARVTLERITHMANEATTSPDFPGLLVVPEVVDGNEYPDTLVIWHPSSGTPYDPDGRPRFDELVIYCPNPDRPNELLELTAPGDTRTVPKYNEASNWKTEIDALKNSDATRKTVLTALVRMASTDGTNMAYSLRPCVRFNVRLRPSEANLTEFGDGNVPWEELPWVQNIYSPSIGLRQVWMRVEMQLVPGSHGQTEENNRDSALTFLDSAAVHYTLTKEN